MKKGVAVAAAWRPISITVAKRLWLAVFMAPLASFAMDFSEAEKLIKPYDPPTRSYLIQRVTDDSGIALDEKKVCAELPGGGVTQILRINQEGVVDLVVSNVQTPQSECYEKVYLGRAYKTPPSAPIYIKQKVGYTSK